MRILLSLPTGLTHTVHELEGLSIDRYFCRHDPEESKLGSAGGTAYLLHEAWKEAETELDFESWLETEKRILIHGGGQSRRLPAYAPMGKLLAPLPIFPKIKGQSISQNLLNVQLPFLEELLEKAPPSLNTLIACGDAWVRASSKIPYLPEVDVLFFGLWTKVNIASKHGVFFCPRTSRNEWAFALQKPSEEKILELSDEYHYLIDVGICMLSLKALKLLLKKCAWKRENQCFEGGIPNYFDLYGEFTQCLGSQAQKYDPDFEHLSYALVPLPEGEFYHFGSSKDLIRSTQKLQERKKIEGEKKTFQTILHAKVEASIKEENDHIWIENSHIASGWKLQDHHLISGVPENDWQIDLPERTCLDIIPVDEAEYCLRPYGYGDLFRGNLHRAHWMGKEFQSWMNRRGISFEEAELDPHIDIQQAAIFPVLKEEELSSSIVQWMIEGAFSKEGYKEIWLRKRFSAEEISRKANLGRLYTQRKSFQKENLASWSIKEGEAFLPLLDLSLLARDFEQMEISADKLQGKLSNMSGIAESMLKSEIERLKLGTNTNLYEVEAFGRLRSMFLEGIRETPSKPRRNLLPDQLLIAKAPLRMDLAGGWSDTPPYCLNYGGRVVNVAIEINGQPPIQVVVKATESSHFLLRSIDQAKEERVDSFASLSLFDQLGEAFAIPKAALALAGFLPEFSQHKASDLATQIQQSGGGVEITTLVAVPKGSGLGTISILAAAVLAALADVYQLGWDKYEICHKVLILEQMLTSGGGWQDQYGGVFPGIKYLKTRPGLGQELKIRQHSVELWKDPEYKPNMLLYYTGITRVAQNILGEIVRSMFLNTNRHMRNIHRIYQHGKDTNKVAKKYDYLSLANMISKSWELNKELDAGTNPPEIEQIFNQIGPYTTGAKLLGAGGGGFLFIMANDREAAKEIKRILEETPPNDLARFVEFEVSEKGLEIIRT
ncbi:MAG: bifunctional fucokinase/fucose-1-phosphate guanylyltransferase [Bacteroidota bacterium]